MTIEPGRFNVPKARLAPAMISTPGHRASIRRQREALPAWSLRIGIAHSVFLLDRGSCLLRHHGSLWSHRLLITNASRWVEGNFDGLPCVQPHCLAGRNFDTRPCLWIPTVARIFWSASRVRCVPRRSAAIARRAATVPFGINSPPSPRNRAIMRSSSGLLPAR